MNNYIIILIGVLLFWSLGYVDAQNNIVQENHSISTNMRFVSQNGSQITCEVKPNFQKIESELKKKGMLKMEISDEVIKVVIDSTTQSVFLSLDTTKVKFDEIKTRLNSKGYNFTRKKDNATIEVIDAKPPIPSEKYDLEIDRFLNREDTLIFSTNFMNLSENQIHSRSYNYYQLIKKIYTLKGMLSNLNYMTIRVDLEEMGKLIDKINDKEISPKNQLPSPLLEYYKSLVKKYGVIYDNIYPNR